MKILGVEKNSIAEELGILPGDDLTAFDSHPVVDILDYEFYTARDSFVMTVTRGDTVTDYEIEKDWDEIVGLELEREIPVKSCRNNCIFCFVSQLPKHEQLRNSLRVRDDDYRHSFISGNYITMTNLTDVDLERIIRLHLSPLYISVHTTDNNLRAHMLGHRNPPDILRQMQKLHEAGIVMHTQIVYCPTVNEDLEKTIRDVSNLAASLAIVPVGLTKDCNSALRPVLPHEAARVIEIVERSQRELLPKLGTRFVFAADEFYCKANLPIPPAEAYEQFDQLENGIGLLAAFFRDFAFALAAYTGTVGTVSIATGKSAYPYILRCAQQLTQKFGGTIHVYAIENTFFGESVTVAGLVVGRDIVAQLAGKPLGDRLLLPRTMLREFNDVFLDNTTVGEVAAKLGVTVQPIAPDGESFVKAILQIEDSL